MLKVRINCCEVGGFGGFGRSCVFIDLGMDMTYHVLPLLGSIGDCCCKLGFVCQGHVSDICFEGGQGPSAAYKSTKVNPGMGESAPLETIRTSSKCQWRATASASTDQGPKSPSGNQKRFYVLKRGVFIYGKIYMYTHICIYL